MLGSNYRQALKDQRNSAGENLLHTCPDVATAIGLVSQGVEINGRNTGGQVPLHRQMRQGHRDVVLYLLTQTTQIIDPNAQERDGTSPLHLAEDEDVNNTLLSHPQINPNIKNNNGMTPLMLAVTFNKNKNIVASLLAHPQIRTGEVDNSGRTALDYAASQAATANGVEIYNLIKAKTEAQSFSAGGFVPVGGMFAARAAPAPFSTIGQAASAATRRQPKPPAQQNRCSHQ